MTDRLNQIGKTLKQDKKNVRYAIDRYSENFPKIERIRDILSAEGTGDPAPKARDFDMHFKVKQPDNRVMMDLTFFGTAIGVPPAISEPPPPLPSDIPPTVTTVCNLISPSGDNGRTKGWPFAYPGDGRSYAVGWGHEGYTVSYEGTPKYRGVMAWGLWGDEGPGAPVSVVQILASVPLNIQNDPSITVRIVGEMSITSAGKSLAGGSAETDIEVIFKTFDYGSEPNHPPPPYTDYTLTGTDEVSFPFHLNFPGVTGWVPFSVPIPQNHVSTSDTGEALLQWAIEIPNIFDALADAGPLKSTGIGLAHTGSISINFQNLYFEVCHQETV